MNGSHCCTNDMGQQKGRAIACYLCKLHVVCRSAETQLAWKHLGHSETQELIKVQKGHGSYSCSDVFKGLGLSLPENRTDNSTWRTSKWFSARRETEGIRRPGQQAACRKQQCPDNEEAMIHRLQKMREELEELRDEFYDVRFRAIFSSLDDKESPMKSRCILQDPPRPTLEAPASPSKRHSTCSMTKGAAEETLKHSEFVSLDQLVAELCPASDDSPSFDTLIKELLGNWDQEELPDREAAGSEAQSAFPRPLQDKEGYVLRDGSSVTPELAAGSQGPHSRADVTKVSSGEAENNADLLAYLCFASGNSPACDALLNTLLETWEEEELQDRAEAGLRDSEPESVLSLPPREEEEDTVPSPLDSSPCDKGHSKPLPTAALEDVKISGVCASPAGATDEPETAWMQAVCAQAVPPQGKPCGDGAPAGACPVPAQALARSAPARPAGMAPEPQPPAPRPWRSMAKMARRALHRCFSFSCLRGQPEE
ncbi:hypothetical protein Nmel_000746 [Mimus melanotis]